MIIREYSLPEGWYPHDTEKISGFLKNYPPKEPFSSAVIAPHAGWYYCGSLAALAVSRLNPNAETTIVLGGHLPSSSPALFAMEDAVKTPFGPLPIDTDLRSALFTEIAGLFTGGCGEDIYRDNTVEVLLPMLEFYLPKTALVWLRLPANITSFEAGITIAKTAAKLKRKVNVTASADLTHYGPNYGFSPKGSGLAALRWVREENDANFIKAIKEGDHEQVLSLAHSSLSCCCAGAVLGVMGFANARGLPKAQLLDYATSADIDKTARIPDSFVGYAAMLF